MSSTREPRLMQPRRPFAITPSRVAAYFSYAVLLMAGLTAVFIRLRFLGVPLERDEGEYAYGGQLLLDGIDPYHFCYTMKLPGTAGFYAVIMGLFGQTNSAVHLGLLLTNLATAGLLYALAKRLFTSVAGAWTVACFLVLSLQPSILGLAAHATQFVILPVVGGLLLLLQGTRKPRAGLLFLSGLLFGLAFLMKQPGIFFGIDAFLYLLYLLIRSHQSLARILLQACVFLLGLVLPCLLVGLAVFAAGDFWTFWFWTVLYARNYGTEVSLSDVAQILGYTLPLVTYPVWPVLLISLLGFQALLWNAGGRKHNGFMLGLVLFSLAAVSSGLYFRNHYFTLLLPALSLLCGVAVSGSFAVLGALRGAKIPLMLLGMIYAGCLAACIVMQKDLFFGDPRGVFAQSYAGNPFLETEAIAEHLKAMAKPGDSLAVIGSEPQLYFYTHLRSATGYVYMYPLMEEQPFAHTMQEEMMAEIALSRPRFLIFVSTRLSWLLGPLSDKTMIQWAEKYARDHYTMIGVSDNVGQGPEYHWTNAAAYTPRSHFTVYVFERKGEVP